MRNRDSGVCPFCGWAFLEFLNSREKENCPDQSQICETLTLVTTILHSSHPGSHEMTSRRGHCSARGSFRPGLSKSNSQKPNEVNVARLKVEQSYFLHMWAITIHPSPLPPSQGICLWLNWFKCLLVRNNKQILSLLPSFHSMMRLRYESTVLTREKKITHSLWSELLTERKHVKVPWVPWLPPELEARASSALEIANRSDSSFYKLVQGLIIQGAC